jgi:hypothetical protein
MRYLKNEFSHEKVPCIQNVLEKVKYVTNSKDVLILSQPSME